MSNQQDAREQARHKASVMIAFAEGKQIQCQTNEANDWEDIDYPSWSWVLNRYRVKPEERKPREWRIEYLGGGQTRFHGPELEYGMTNVREVLPETETEL